MMFKYYFYNKDNLQLPIYTCDTDIEITELANNLDLQEVEKLVVQDSISEVYSPLINYRE